MIVFPAARSYYGTGDGRPMRTVTMILPAIVAAALAAALAAAPLGAQEPGVAPPADARPWIGVWLGDAVDGGVRIARVVPDGPAAAAGLEAGDVIVEVDGTPVPSEERLGLLLGERRAGDVIRLAVLRGGESVTLPVRSRPWSQRVAGLVVSPSRPLRPAPQADADVPGLVHLQWLGRSGLGVTVTTMTPELREHFGAPADEGVLVTGVEPDGPAGRAGVRVGDVMIDVAGREVRTPIDVNGATLAWYDRPSTELVVVRDGERVALAVRSDRAREALSEAERVRVERLRERLRAERDRLERRLREITRQLDELASAPAEID